MTSMEQVRLVAVVDECDLGEGIGSLTGEAADEFNLRGQVFGADVRRMAAAMRRRGEFFREQHGLRYTKGANDALHYLGADKYEQC